MLPRPAMDANTKTKRSKRARVGGSGDRVQLHYTAWTKWCLCPSLRFLFPSAPPGPYNVSSGLINPSTSSPFSDEDFFFPGTIAEAGSPFLSADSLPCSSLGAPCSLPASVPPAMPAQSPQCLTAGPQSPPSAGRAPREMLCIPDLTHPLGLAVE